MPSFPQGQTITVHTRTITGHDRDNTPIWSSVPTDVPGCAVWPRVSAETLQGQDTVVTGITVLAPPGTVVLATDQVTVGGRLYQVTGDPADYASPLTGTQAGVELQLVTATG